MTGKAGAAGQRARETLRFSTLTASSLPLVQFPASDALKSRYDRVQLLGAAALSFKGVSKGQIPPEKPLDYWVHELQAASFMSKIDIHLSLLRSTIRYLSALHEKGMLEKELMAHQLLITCLFAKDSGDCDNRPLAGVG